MSSPVSLDASPLAVQRNLRQLWRMLVQFADDHLEGLPSWVGLVLLFAFGSKNTDEESFVL